MKQIMMSELLGMYRRDKGYVNLWLGVCFYTTKRERKNRVRSAKRFRLSFFVGKGKVRKEC